MQPIKYGNHPLMALGETGRLKSPEDILREMGGAIQEMGPARSHQMLVGLLDEDMITLLGGGQTGFDAALADARARVCTTKTM